MSLWGVPFALLRTLLGFLEPAQRALGCLLPIRTTGHVTLLELAERALDLRPNAL